MSPEQLQSNVIGATLVVCLLLVTCYALHHSYLLLVARWAPSLVRSAITMHAVLVVVQASGCDHVLSSLEGQHGSLHGCYNALQDVCNCVGEQTGTHHAHVTCGVYRWCWREHGFGVGGSMSWLFGKVLWLLGQFCGACYAHRITIILQCWGSAQCGGLLVQLCLSLKP